MVTEPPPTEAAVTALGPDQRADGNAQLTGVAFASDGHLPFRDNVNHARRHGVTCIAEPGGSIRSDQVAAACQEYGITLARIAAYHAGLTARSHDDLAVFSPDELNTLLLFIERSEHSIVGELARVRQNHDIG